VSMMANMKEWENGWNEWWPSIDLEWTDQDKDIFKAGWDAAVRSSAELLRRNYGHSESDIRKEVYTAYKQIKGLAEDKQ